MTLYEYVGPSEYKEQFDRQAYGLLKAVAPDYEAAANKVREYDSKTVAAWKIAEAVVNAALGDTDAVGGM